MFRIHRVSSLPAALQFLNAMPSSYGGGILLTAIEKAPAILPTVIDATAEAEHVDTPISVADVPCDGSLEQLALDESIRIRRKLRFVYVYLPNSGEIRLSFRCL